MAETCVTAEVEKEKLLTLEIDNSPFSDAIYKELAKINGRINQMTKSDIISKLKQYKLSSEGSCDILKKRLKNHYKKQKLTSVNLHAASKLHPYYVIVDFEATCQEVNPTDYPHEIIEFPAVLVHTEKQKIVDEFQAYCRPVLNPKLSDFCMQLTGITQEQVDSAQTFAEVLISFEAWLKKHQLGYKNQYATVTDGPWDMARFLLGQCKISDITFPNFAKKWINIRKVFSNFYKSQRFSLHLMLKHLEIKFEGRPHCGLDDARNIASILLRLVSDGASIQVNERIYLTFRDGKNPNTERKGAKSQIEGMVVPVYIDSRNIIKVRRERSIREHNKNKMKGKTSNDSDEETGKENQCVDDKEAQAEP